MTTTHLADKIRAGTTTFRDNSVVAQILDDLVEIRPHIRQMFDAFVESGIADADDSVYLDAVAVWLGDDTTGTHP